MRLLHTADWHLGRTLETHSREAEHERFLAWLLGVVAAERIDALLVAGDVFDAAQPSAEAQRLYYRALHALREAGLRHVVVVGGNHDSASRLEAPRELLGGLGVSVVGGLPDETDRERLVVPLQVSGEVRAACLAVPYVHEWRLGVRPDGEEGAVRSDLEARLGAIYRQAADLARQRFPGVPLVATGHLTVGAYEKGDAPADVHMVGQLGALSPALFDARLAYVALGHIHRPMPVAGSRAVYAGSPVALTPKEGASARKVVVVEVPEDPDAAASFRFLPTPLSRELLEVRGPLDEVAARLASLASPAPLPPLVFATVLVEAPDPTIDARLRKVVEGRGGGLILARIDQARAREPVRGAEPAAVPLEELTPLEVFRRLCARRGVAPSEALERALLQVAAEAEGAA